MSDIKPMINPSTTDRQPMTVKTSPDSLEQLMIDTQSMMDCMNTLSLNREAHDSTDSLKENINSYDGSVHLGRRRMEKIKSVRSKLDGEHEIKSTRPWIPNHQHSIKRYFENAPIAINRESRPSLKLIEINDSKTNSYNTTNRQMTTKTMNSNTSKSNTLNRVLSPSLKSTNLDENTTSLTSTDSNESNQSIKSMTKNTSNPMTTKNKKSSPRSLSAINRDFEGKLKAFNLDSTLTFHHSLRSSTSRKAKKRVSNTKRPKSARVIEPSYDRNIDSDQWIGAFYVKLKEWETQKRPKERKRMVDGKHSTDSKVQIGNKLDYRIERRFKKRMARRVTRDQHLRNQRDAGMSTPAGMFRKRTVS